MLFDKDWIAPLETAVKDHVRDTLTGRQDVEVFDLDQVEASCRDAMKRLASTMMQAWAAHASETAVELAGRCPSCGHARKVRRRSPMEVTMLGMLVEVPKPYLECGRCEAPGVSIMTLLTGLRSGANTAEVELMAAYCGAEKTYGRASRDLDVHHDIEVERTAVRRMALEVEEHAIRFSDAERKRAVGEVGHEQRTEGVACLMMQADGGNVRVGKLRATQPGDPGHGKLTPKTKQPRRARDDAYREVINFDVREPGSLNSCMDVMVPCVSGDTERWQCMLATAQRAGLGDNTLVRGLGDMGSSLASSFDEAFVGYDARYCADWKHTSDYVTTAAKFITHQRPEDWVSRTKEALWHRDRARVDTLLRSARERRVEELPPNMERCPVQALITYVENNWERFHAKAFKDAGLDFVSARAECQVRERIKARFSNAGAWRVENIEGKAVLRTIIADGRWPAFRDHYIRTRAARFRTELRERLTHAVADSRLPQDALAVLLPDHAPPSRMAA